MSEHRAFWSAFELWGYLDEFTESRPDINRMMVCTYGAYVGLDSDGWMNYNASRSIYNILKRVQSRIIIGTDAIGTGARNSHEIYAEVISKTFPKANVKLLTRSHAKYILLDNGDVFIGSANLSLSKWNDVIVRIEDSDLYGELRTDFNLTWKNAEARK